MTKVFEKSDLGKSFKTLVDFTFIKYDGILIERCGDQYKVAGKLYPSLEAAKKSIDTPLKAARSVQ